MDSEQTNLLQRTLDLIILKALMLEPMHGLSISPGIEQITKATFKVKAGSRFPAPHRMEESAGSRRHGANQGRRAKRYAFTKAGRRPLETETERWGRISSAIARALEAT